MAAVMLRLLAAVLGLLGLVHLIPPRALPVLLALALITFGLTIGWLAQVAWSHHRWVVVTWGLPVPGTACS
jgi:hypothetical protein